MTAIVAYLPASPVAHVYVLPLYGGVFVNCERMRFDAFFVFIFLEKSTINQNLNMLSEYMFYLYAAIYKLAR